MTGGRNDPRKQGVYFARSDYAGLGRRLAIVAIDVTVLLLVVIIEVLAFEQWLESGRLELAFLTISYLYLGVLKATPLGTLGYLITGVRLVDLKGNRPSILRATFRFIFVVFGPINLIFDLAWLGGDPDRQTLRDKFMGTYVIRKNALAAGHGRIKTKAHFLLGYTFLFREVDRRAVKPAR